MPGNRTHKTAHSVDTLITHLYPVLSVDILAWTLRIKSVMKANERNAMSPEHEIQLHQHFNIVLAWYQGHIGESAQNRMTVQKCKRIIDRVLSAAARKEK